MVFSFRKIERSEFGEVAWGGGCGRNTGCVKGGLPLVLTLDASLVLQQVEAAAVNSFRFHPWVMRAKGEHHGGIDQSAAAGAAGIIRTTGHAAEARDAPRAALGDQLFSFSSFVPLLETRTTRRRTNI